MADFDTRRSDTEIEGCLIALDVSVKNDGELTIDQLEQIDNVMLNFGTERTGQRLEVNMKPDMVRSRVKYVYQETFQARSFDNLRNRFEIQTDFEHFFIIIGTEVVNLRENEDE